MDPNTIGSGSQFSGPEKSRPAHFLLAAQALEQILDARKPADAIVGELLRKHRSGARDRALISSLVYGVLRNYFPLRAKAGGSAPMLELCVALWLETGRMPPPLREVDAESLRARLSAAPPADPAARHNLPDWMWRRLERQYGAEAGALAAALNEEAGVDLRVNLLRGTREQCIGLLGAEGIEALPVPGVATAIRLPRRMPLAALECFKAGWIEPQDAGSQQLVCWLAARPGQRVADFCAGAGGKTLALGAAMQDRGELLALDTSAARLSRLEPRLRRAGLSIATSRRLSADGDSPQDLAAAFDIVLVDAPCSGSGTLRRHPELRLQPDRLAEFAARQSSILERAAPLVGPGGRLAYATCSLFREENQDVTDAFLARHPRFAAGEALQLLPHRDGTDGYWAVTLLRVR